MKKLLLIFTASLDSSPEVLIKLTESKQAHECIFLSDCNQAKLIPSINEASINGNTIILIFKDHAVVSKENQEALIKMKGDFSQPIFIGVHGGSDTTKIKEYRKQNLNWVRQSLSPLIITRKFSRHEAIQQNINQLILNKPETKIYKEYLSKLIEIFECDFQLEVTLNFLHQLYLLDASQRTPDSIQKIITSFKAKSSFKPMTDGIVESLEDYHKDKHELWLSDIREIVLEPIFKLQA